jgi:hypothetical protein
MAHIEISCGEKPPTIKVNLLDVFAVLTSAHLVCSATNKVEGILQFLDPHSIVNLASTCKIIQSDIQNSNIPLIEFGTFVDSDSTPPHWGEKYTTITLNRIKKRITVDHYPVVTTTLITKEFASPGETDRYFGFWDNKFNIIKLNRFEANFLKVILRRLISNLD